jgi:Tfp pilus assembly protein FimT
MLCFLCGKKIGFLRSMVDQQYCSTAHRQEAGLASAQALRDEEELEPWSVAKSRNKHKSFGRNAPTAGQTASIFAFLTVGGLLVAALVLPGPGPGNAFPTVSLDPSVKRGLVERLSDSVGEAVRRRAPVTLHADFKGRNLTTTANNVADWATLNLRASTTQMDDPRDWIGNTRPSATLKLWKRSAKLQNYQMEFQAELQQNSLSWAFRAQDASNHYATKLAITRTGPLPNASLIRYVMMNGREYDHVQLPLPVTLARGEDYRVRMTVQDNRFVTYLNGNVISSWTDDRLLRGGVGFFTDDHDPQKVEWVSVSERDSFLGRLLGHFALFVLPGEPQY